jgi:hypothetical protein
MALASLRRTLVFFAHEGRDKQRINALSKKIANSAKIVKSGRLVRICRQFSGSVNRSRSFAGGDYRTLLFRCHRRSEGDLIACPIYQTAPEAC